MVVVIFYFAMSPYIKSGVLVRSPRPVPSPWSEKCIEASLVLRRNSLEKHVSAPKHLESCCASRARLIQTWSACGSILVYLAEVKNCPKSDPSLQCGQLAMIGEVSLPQPNEGTKEEAASMGTDRGFLAKSIAVAVEPVALHGDEESEEIRRMFRSVDVDNDGMISRAELAAFVKNLEHSLLTEKQIDCILKAYDENGSGSLVFPEFLKLYRSLEEGDGSHEELLRDVFNVFDANKDGLISPEELQLIVQNLNLGKGKKVFDFGQMIKAVDSNGDGFVDIKEFAQLMTRSLCRSQ